MKLFLLNAIMRILQPDTADVCNLTLPSWIAYFFA